jgi:hypothetical protein
VSFLRLKAFVPETKCFGAYRIVRFGAALGYFWINPEQPMIMK